MPLLDNIQLFDLNNEQLAYTALIFIWSGFVRSGLGFGGAALSLPLLLLVSDKPLFWLPIIGLHLLFFTALTLRNRLTNVDWPVLAKTSGYILPGKLIGVFGLLSLPNNWLIIIIYSITIFYAMLWVFNLTLHSHQAWMDKVFLFVGGYFSGTSLTGAPLIAAVYANLIKRDQLRDSLFVLWFILVSIKLATFNFFEVDLQFQSAVILIPIAAVGHIAGLKLHAHITANDQRFKRVIGAVLVIICGLGLGRLVFV